MAVHTKGGTTQYLSGCTNDSLEAAVAEGLDVGLLIQPRSGYLDRLDRFPTWAADNGAFSKVRTFDPAAFRRMLADPRLAAARERCLFVVAPDKLVVIGQNAKGKDIVVGDARGTLEQFEAWALEIRAAGFPVALVAQDGLEFMLGDIPWGLVDVMFLGGSTEWKVGAGGRRVARVARLMGKRVHMGRVNSGKRLDIADGFGCDTADGTFLGFGPDTNLARLLRWPGIVRRMRELRRAA